jgi:hypothetical protein
VPPKLDNLENDPQQAHFMMSCYCASEFMTNAKPRGALVAGMFGAFFVLFVVIPAVISMANGDGAICFTASACPLSAVNPCVRHPSFAVVGRCAIAIR